MTFIVLNNPLNREIQRKWPIYANTHLSLLLLDEELIGVTHVN